jgi:hypothetical protein
MAAAAPSITSPQNIPKEERKNMASPCTPLLLSEKEKYTHTRIPEPGVQQVLWDSEDYIQN